MCAVIDVLTAYAAACAAANITIKAALTLPENWDGPAGMHLSVVGDGVYGDGGYWDGGLGRCGCCRICEG